MPLAYEKEGIDLTFSLQIEKTFFKDENDVAYQEIIVIARDISIHVQRAERSNNLLR